MPISNSVTLISSKEEEKGEGRDKPRFWSLNLINMTFLILLRKKPGNIFEFH